MNSEELEQSLRTEFEGYLRNVLADMKQEVSNFQQKIDVEIEKHKSHLDDVFQEFSERIQPDKKLDEGFKESVIEHLRLARDEGARITATAIAEAEELTKAAAKNESRETEPSVELADIRDAISDISSQNSQSAILKSLITHAAKFTPRGAFFVVKNQHFVGWRLFGKDNNTEEDSITEVIFPISASTVLGESVRSLSVVESAYGVFQNDSDYLTQIDFGQPEKMFAIPLIARGRGVAAIYADNGDENEKVNVEALETLVSVAGLTVELLAAAQNSNYTREPVKTTSYAAPATESTKEEVEEIEDSKVASTESYEEVEETVEEVETAPEETVEEIEAVSEEEVEEFGKTTSFYYQKPEETTSYADSSAQIQEEETASYTDSIEEIEEDFSYTDEKETEESLDSADSDIQEVEVEEPVSYAETAETESEPVYEVSDEVETASSEDVSEEDDLESETETEVETIDEQSYSFSSEETDEVETVQPDYSAYDDDLIEEVQAQTETPEQEVVEAVYEETPAVETQSEEVEEEPVETFWSQPTEEVKEAGAEEVETVEEIDEISTSHSMESDSVYDSGTFDTSVKTFEKPNVTDTYSEREEFSEFETNQDFNSSPVQFEETVEAVEPTGFEYSQPVEVEEPEAEEVETIEEIDEIKEVSFDASQLLEQTEPETVEAEPAQVEQASEPVAATPPVRTRFSERNVDLPIEVSEEERRLHNDARRFARLLVSEIKLYNEQKVKEGRESNDLYERLREAIDRSREMYDKRVQPVVVDKFDYFHYEVVNTLAEGEESKLGNHYPKVAV